MTDPTNALRESSDPRLRPLLALLALEASYGADERADLVVVDHLGARTN